MAVAAGVMDFDELVEESPWLVQVEYSERAERDITWIETQTGTTVVKEFGREVGAEIPVLLSLVPQMLTICRLEEVISVLEDLMAVYDTGCQRVLNAMNTASINAWEDRKVAQTYAELTFDHARHSARSAVVEYDGLAEMVGEGLAKALSSWTFESFRKGDVKKVLSMLEMRAGTERGDVLLQLDEAAEGRENW